MPYEMTKRAARTRGALARRAGLPRRIMDSDGWFIRELPVHDEELTAALIAAWLLGYDSA
mgnify:CR=1 FL=1